MKHKCKVACLQVKAREYKDRNLTENNILEMIDTAGRENAQLLVLPEAVYPVYYLSSLFVKDPDEFNNSTLNLIKKIKRKAKKYQCYIAFGFVENDQKNKKLYNAAMLVNTEGKEILRARKSYLWHFDADWFSSGIDFTVAKTEFGKVGMFICADGRLPEIPRCLSLNGANIMLDLTNWVTGGFKKENLSNPQAEYMVPVRAMENQAWIIAANKVGLEANSILYCGKSAVFTPQGEIAKMATSYKEEILYYEIPLKSIESKETDEMDFQNERRPELYGILTLPNKNTPIYSLMMEKKSRNCSPLFTAVTQLDFNTNFKDYLNQIIFSIKNMIQQKAKLIILPENQFIFPEKGKDIIERICKVFQDKKAMIAISVIERIEEKYFKTTFLLYSGKIIGKYRKTHLDNNEKELLKPGDLGLPVFHTPYGNIGIMIGYEGYYPEIARVLSLKGAEIIIWPSKFGKDQQVKISQCRSSENKIFIACSNSISGKGNGHSLITSPSGHVLSACLENKEQSCMASLLLQLSLNKNIVPNTDVIINRNPKKYQILIQEREAKIEN